MDNEHMCGRVYEYKEHMCRRVYKQTGIVYVKTIVNKDEL